MNHKKLTDKKSDILLERVNYIKLRTSLENQKGAVPISPNSCVAMSCKSPSIAGFLGSYMANRRIPIWNRSQLGV